MIDADRALWLEVIHRAKKDAEGRVDTSSSAGRKRAWIVEEARDWFRTNSRDFQMVCAWADVDPECLRDKMLKKFGKRKWKPPVKRVLTPHRAVAA